MLLVTKMTAPAFRTICLLVSASAAFLLAFPNPVFGQNLSGAQIATNLEIQDSSAEPGDILSISDDDNLLRSSFAYDQNIFGVVAEDPAIVLNRETNLTLPVVSEGEVRVKVSNSNGNIEVGDLITSSATPGVGQRASAEGFVLGKALAPYQDSSVGSIPILLNIHYQSQLSGGGSDLGEVWNKLIALTSAGLQEDDSLQLILRYLFALLVGLLSFILGFYFAARAIRTGLVAIGRNPLAKDTIQAGMFFNLFTVIAIAMAGVGLSLFIIFYR